MMGHREEVNGLIVHCTRCGSRKQLGALWSFACHSTDQLPSKPAAPTVLPSSSVERKNCPLARGVLDYFPAALAAVAEVSRIGNAQHNPGEEMHWARGKSSDHADCIVRHLVERGTLDSDGVAHSAKVAWRALALLQEELEAAGAAPGRASRFPAEGRNNGQGK